VAALGFDNLPTPWVEHTALMMRDDDTGKCEQADREAFELFMKFQDGVSLYETVREACELVAGFYGRKKITYKKQIEWRTIEIDNRWHGSLEVEECLYDAVIKKEDTRSYRYYVTRSLLIIESGIASSLQAARIAARAIIDSDLGKERQCPE